MTNTADRAAQIKDTLRSEGYTYEEIKDIGKTVRNLGHIHTEDKGDLSNED